MIERETIRDAAATIMPRDRETRVPECFHHGHHIVRHRPLRIWRVIRTRGRTAAAAIAAQIRADHGEALSQHRGDSAPHQMRLRETMQQQDGQTGAEAAYEDAGAGALHFERLERLECRCRVRHGWLPGALVSLTNSDQRITPSR